MDDPPVPMPDSFTTQEDTSVDGDVSLNDSDIDSGSLTFAQSSDASHGQVTFRSDGTFTYVPNPDFAGSDGFDYTVSDGTTTVPARVSLTVTPENDAPSAAPDSVSGTNNAPINGDVSTNDSDPEGDTLTYRSLTAPSDGVLEFEEDGSFVFTPAAGTSGTRSFTYEVSDGDLTDTAEVTIEIEAINAAPTANDDMASVSQSETVQINLLQNDFDPDDDVIEIVSLQTDTTLGQVSDVGGGFVSYDPNGAFAYLAPGERAVDNFSYLIEDNAGAQSTAQVTVHVEGETSVTNSGRWFTFFDRTDKGFTLFGFNGDDFFVAGRGVRGWERYDDIDPLLARAAELFGGVVTTTGNIDDVEVAQGAVPNVVYSSGSREVEISGNGSASTYLLQFNSHDLASDFRDFAERFFNTVDARNAVANDPDSFRFDIGDLRVFCDDVGQEFGTREGKSETRYGDLQSFVDAIVESFGGVTLRNGMLDADRIADGRDPFLRAYAGDNALIAGRSIDRSAVYDFEDPETAREFAHGLDQLFDLVGQTGALAIDDLAVA